MLEKVLQLCGAHLGLLLIYDGESYRVAPLQGAPEAFTFCELELMPASLQEELRI
jgi:hypothetical protein